MPPEAPRRSLRIAQTPLRNEIRPDYRTGLYDGAHVQSPPSPGRLRSLSNKAVAPEVLYDNGRPHPHRGRPQPNASSVTGAGPTRIADGHAARLYRTAFDSRGRHGGHDDSGNDDRDNVFVEHPSDDASESRLRQLLMMETPSHLRRLVKHFTPSSIARRLYTQGEIADDVTPLARAPSPLLSIPTIRVNRVRPFDVGPGHPDDGSSLFSSVLWLCLQIVTMPAVFAYKNIHTILVALRFLCVKPIGLLRSLLARNVSGNAAVEDSSPGPRRLPLAKAATDAACREAGGKGWLPWLWPFALSVGLFGVLWLYSPSSMQSGRVGGNRPLQHRHSADNGDHDQPDRMQELAREWNGQLERLKQRLSLAESKIDASVCCLSDAWQLDAVREQLGALREQQARLGAALVSLAQQSPQACDDSHRNSTVDSESLYRLVAARLLPDISALVDSKHRALRERWARRPPAAASAGARFSVLLQNNVDWAARHTGTRIYLPGTASAGCRPRGLLAILGLSSGGSVRPTVVQGSGSLRKGECYPVHAGGYVTLALAQPMPLRRVLVEHLQSDLASAPLRLQIYGRERIMAPELLLADDVRVNAPHLLADVPIKYVRIVVPPAALGPSANAAGHAFCIYRVHLFSSDQ